MAYESNWLIHVPQYAMDAPSDLRPDSLGRASVFFDWSIGFVSTGF